MPYGLLPVAMVAVTLKVRWSMTDMHGSRPAGPTRVSLLDERQVGIRKRAAVEAALRLTPAR